MDTYAVLVMQACLIMFGVTTAGRTTPIYFTNARQLLSLALLTKVG